MAEAILRHRLAAAGVTAQVSSAGLLPGGRPATADGIEVMAARGLDTAGHRSRQIDRALVAAADLVLGMAREHVREAVVLDPAALDRAFTLKELVHLGELHGPRRAGEDLATWLARVAGHRDQRRLVGVGHDPAYDVEDPIGRSRRAYDATAAELDDLLARLVTLAFAPTTKEHSS